MPFEAEEFAKSLMLHAQTEKEVSSPTAILIGEYIKREAAIILETQQTLREGHPSRELSGCFQP